MTIFEEALNKALDVLDHLGIEWAISGSFALAYHGVIRATHDADIKIRASELEKKWDDLATEMRRAGFAYLDHQTFQYASSFDVELYPASGPIDEQSFRGRIRDRLFENSERKYWLVSAEDLILSKLQEFKRWGDGKHLDDIKRLVLAKRLGLDWPRLERQITKHEGFHKIWKTRVEGGP